jgi:hypothetical protein
LFGGMGIGHRRSLCQRHKCPLNPALRHSDHAALIILARFLTPNLETETFQTDVPGNFAEMLQDLRTGCVDRPEIPP